MEKVRSGERPWIKLDDLHRENLEEVLAEFGITNLSDAEKDNLNRAWHRLSPWPDTVGGLARLAGSPEGEGARSQVMLVAAHNGDLVAAKKTGMRTAFVRRATEYGLNETSAQKAEHDFDYVAESFIDLAEQLGCRL